MSHFIVTTQVPKGKLEQFMRATVGPWSMDITAYVDTDAPAEEKKKSKKGGVKGKRVPSITKLTMTGKKPQHGTKLEQGLKEFEDLEVMHGVGSISISKFREIVEKGVVFRLLHEKYLEYLPEQEIRTI